jgi:hypothetical protein
VSQSRALLFLASSHAAPFHVPTSDSTQAFSKTFFHPRVHHILLKTNHGKSWGMEIRQEHVRASFSLSTTPPRSQQALEKYAAMYANYAKHQQAE